LFLLLSAGAFFLAWSGVLDLPAEMADFPLELIGSVFGTLLALMGLSALAQSKGFQVDRAAKTIRHYRRGMFGRRYDPAIPFDALDFVSVALGFLGQREPEAHLLRRVVAAEVRTERNRRHHRSLRRGPPDGRALRPRAGAGPSRLR
jgi:hypothetical protein